MSSPITILPTKTDLISAGISAAVGYFQGDNVGMAAAEQLGAIIVGKNIANTIDVTDVPVTDPPAMVLEYDYYTAASRAGFSMYKKRSNNKVMMDAAKGLICNLSARYVEKALKEPLI